MGSPSNLRCPRRKLRRFGPGHTLGTPGPPIFPGSKRRAPRPTGSKRRTVFRKLPRRRGAKGFSRAFGREAEASERSSPFETAFFQGWLKKQTRTEANFWVYRHGPKNLRGGRPRSHAFAMGIWSAPVFLYGVYIPGPQTTMGNFSHVGHMKSSWFPQWSSHVSRSF